MCACVSACVRACVRVCVCERCIRSILEINLAQAWVEHISNAELLFASWGDTETIEEKLVHRRL